MLEMTGTAIEDFDASGRVRVHGEVWKAKSDTPIIKGQIVQVISMDGLTLTIRPIAEIQPTPESY